MNFCVLQVFLYAPVTQTYERTQINTLNAWNNSKHERSWLLSAVLLQLAHRWPIRTPSRSSLTPAYLWIPFSWRVEGHIHISLNWPKQTHLVKKYPTPHPGLGLQRCRIPNQATNTSRKLKCDSLQAVGNSAHINTLFEACEWRLN